MRKRFRAVFFTVIMILLCTIAFETGGKSDILIVEAHSGRTDSSGGHHDYRNVSGLGGYHYHCGGYPAHLHPNGVCPYSGSSGGGSSRLPSPRISMKSTKMYAGADLTLKVSGASSKVQWSSSKKSVATVNSKGKVTARKKGTVVITARVGSRKLTCKIKVRPLAINKKKAALEEGSSVRLKINGASQKIKWSSSDEQIAVVNSKGKVTAVSAGKATVTAKVGKKKFNCQVTVKKRIVPIENFYLDEYSIELKEGHTANISAVIEPEDATDRSIIWSSSDPQVATVSQGTVTGVSVGRAQITASCGGYTDSCYVTVKQDFVVTEARDALTYVSYQGDSKVITEVTSQYKYSMELEAKCDFYDSENKLLGSSQDRLRCLETGQTLCMCFNIPYVYNAERTYDHVALSFTPEQSRYRGASRSITHTEAPSSASLLIHIKNNGTETLNVVDVTVVFCKAGKVLDCKTDSVYFSKPNDMDDLNFEYPNSEGNIIVPDDYKVYVETGVDA